MGAVGVNNSSSPYSSGEQKMRVALRSVEDKIRNDSTETAVVYDKDGNEVLNKNQGMPDGVDFTEDEAKLFSDAVFTHNHPSGTTFSSADIQTAISTGLKEIRACYSDGAYVLTRNYDIGDVVPVKYQYLAQDYQYARDEYRTTVVDPIWNNSSQTEAEAQKCNTMLSDFRKKWLSDHSHEYGWTYKEEKK